MARFVFFSFHFQEDVWRANQVRRLWEFGPARFAEGFYDRSLWESAKTRGDTAIKQMIDEALRGCSVNVVLIGAKTATRRWVNYEIEQCIARRMGFVGLHISAITDQRGKTAEFGSNPLDNHIDPRAGQRLSSIYPTYYWHKDGGHEHIGGWIESAARLAGR